MLTETFVNIIVNTISALGYFGIFLLMISESMLFPLPSEIIMTFSGFLISTGKLNFFLVVLYGTIGNTIGASAAFYVGHHFKHKVIERFIQKYGKFFFITKEEFERSERIFQKHGAWVITLSRLLPGIRSIISIPAGASHMPFKSFVIFSLIGSFLWCFMLAFIGTMLGSNWQSVKVIFHKFDLIIIISFIMILGVYFYKKFRKTPSVQKNKETAL